MDWAIFPSTFPAAPIFFYVWGPELLKFSHGVGVFAPRSRNFWVLLFVPAIFGYRLENQMRARAKKNFFFSEFRPTFLTASVSALQTLCTLSHLNMSKARCGKHPQVRVQNLPDIGVGETLCRSWASNSACNLTTRISCSKPGIWEFF